MFQGRSLWLAYAIVFVSSACSLIIELVAGRIMAPYIGVSLYTWTSIIGVVLAGISLGNYVGGRLADRWGGRALLRVILLASGVTSIAILPATAYVATNTATIPLVPKIVLFTTLIFFVPSCLMGMVSPIVIKLSLTDLHRTGNVVGRIYAISTMGSIFGTFITGFVLVSWLGTRTIVWVVAATLIVLGIAVGDWRNRRAVVAALIAVAVYGGALGYRQSFLAPCVAETNYYCINVFGTSLPEVGEVKAIVLDHLVHSYVSTEDPRKLGYGYERIYAELTAYLAQKHDGDMRTLFIGGGGYTFPRYVDALYPGSSIDVVEIDPGVTAVAHDYLGLPYDTKITTHNEDARLFFAHPAASPPYNIIYGDAFNDLSVPYHLTTMEFDREIRDRLGDDGYYLANIIDNPQRGEFLKAYLRTMKQVFPHVYLLAQGALWNVDGQSTFVVAGMKQPLDVAEFRQVSGGEGRAMFSEVMADDALDGLIADSSLRFWREPVWGKFASLRNQALALSDDYAPVDQLVAPLFLERGF